MNVELLSVPYDAAERDARMGAGPGRLLDAGLDAALERAGHTVRHRILDPPPAPRRAEIATTFALAHEVARAVRDAAAAGRFPLILSGTCGVAAGVVAGLGRGTAVTWFDAHGDFNTPETTASGFLDGMALAIVAGRCWSQLAAGVVGLVPVPADAICLVGARDLDALERRALDASGVAVLDPAAARARLPAALAALRRRAARAYLHLDLDVLDPAIGAVNEFAAPGGLGLDEVRAMIAAVGRALPIAGATVSAYDPAFDGDGRVATAAVALARDAVAAAGAGPLSSC
jgi:arginase